MKPVTFDITPLANALRGPSTLTAPERQKRQKRPERPLTRPTERAVRVAVCPRRITHRGGWLATLAGEQIHALATHVLARHAEQGLSTVAMTSALAGEGKTTLTMALAEKLASADKRVLVIDLDTHRSTLSRAAGLNSVRGAIESSDPSEAAAPGFFAYATDCHGVSIMPTGRVGAAVPLLSPDRILGLCQRAFEEYDLVLLDCPPLMPVADAHMIGEVADTSILVVKAGSTPREILDRAVEDFGREKIFAAVLNYARPSAIPYFREVYGYYQRASN